MQYQAIVIGTSAGGLNALKIVFSSLHENFSIPILVVQHISSHSDNYITKFFNNLCMLNVKEADEKEKIEPGNIYFAPPNFHMMVEEDKSISLSVDKKVNFSRPSIDVLFETAVYAYCPALIGIILTGANNDGAKGLKLINDNGGLTIAQNPKTAETRTMPQEAINISKTNNILDLEEIGKFLNKIDKDQKKILKNLN
ncbi:MAG: chemotaxis protein CheB [Bacteroidales bacterium]|nr:chemotaxis protein CheB [Bacteroidales bacterium]